MISKTDKYKRFWDLLSEDRLDNSYAEELITAFRSADSSGERCTLAIFLGAIRNGDQRIPDVLFGILNDWNKSDYGGWVVTTYARLYLYYPHIRDRYRQLMFSGNPTQRRILASALFFLRNADRLYLEQAKRLEDEVLSSVISDFLKVEKDEEIREHISEHLKVAQSSKHSYQQF